MTFSLTPQMRPKVYAFVIGFILLLAVGGTGFLGEAPWSPPEIVRNIPTSWATPEPVLSDVKRDQEKVIAKKR